MNKKEPYVKSPNVKKIKHINKYNINAEKKDSKEITQEKEENRQKEEEKKKQIEIIKEVYLNIIKDIYQIYCK